MLQKPESFAIVFDSSETSRVLDFAEYNFGERLCIIN